MEGYALDKEEITKNEIDIQNISIETDTDDIVPTYVYVSSQKLKHEEPKVELTLNRPDSLGDIPSFQRTPGFADVIRTLERENEKMEKSIRKLTKKEARIEKENHILREMLSEMLSKLSS